MAIAEDDNGPGKRKRTKRAEKERKNLRVLEGIHTILLGNFKRLKETAFEI